MSVVTLAGSNSFLIDSELNKRLAAFIDLNGDMSVEHIDAESVDPSGLFSRLSSPSLFAPQKLTVIRGLSRNGELSEKFSELLSSSRQDADIILVEAKIDARGKLYKTLKSKTEFIEFGALNPIELSRWIVQYVSSKGGNITTGNANYLVNKVGTNQQMLCGELNKLLLYSSNITQANIDLLVEPGIGSTTFDLANAAFNHDTENAVRLYREQRSLRIDPAVIIGSLAWQLHVLALLKTSGSNDIERIAKDSKMSPWALSKAKHLAEGISLKDLTSAIDQLILIDAKSKSEQINVDDALIYFLLRIS